MALVRDDMGCVLGTGSIIHGLVNVTLHSFVLVNSGEDCKVDM